MSAKLEQALRIFNRLGSAENLVRSAVMPKEAALNIEELVEEIRSRLIVGLVAFRNGALKNTTLINRMVRVLDEYEGAHAEAREFVGAGPDLSLPQVRRLFHKKVSDDLVEDFRSRTKDVQP